MATRLAGPTLSKVSEIPSAFMFCSSARTFTVPFTVKVLADEQNMKAEGISLTLLSVGPASRVAMHRHPHSAKILYVVKGHARLLGPEGAVPLKMDEGAAAFVPAGYP